MEYEVLIKDHDAKKDFKTIVKVRSDATIKRVILKAVELVVDDITGDPLDFMREVNYIYRESCDEDDFTEQLKLDLDLEVSWGEI